MVHVDPYSIYKEFIEKKQHIHTQNVCKIDKCSNFDVVELGNTAATCHCQECIDGYIFSQQHSLCVSMSTISHTCMCTSAHTHCHNFVDNLWIRVRTHVHTAHNTVNVESFFPRQPPASCQSPSAAKYTSDFGSAFVLTRTCIHGVLTTHSFQPPTPPPKNMHIHTYTHMWCRVRGAYVHTCTWISTLTRVNIYVLKYTYARTHILKRIYGAGYEMISGDGKDVYDRCVKLEWKIEMTSIITHMGQYNQRVGKLDDVDWSRMMTYVGVFISATLR